MNQMDDAADDTRKLEQSRALDVNRPSGAMILHSHLDRQQEVVGVTRDDLEDILSFDGVAACFAAFGMFLLSGAVWLIAENTLDNNGFAFDPLMAFCIPSVAFGMACLGAGVFFHLKKRSRITRIFSQTKSLAASIPSKTG